MKSLLALIIVSLFQLAAHADPQGTCSDFVKAFDGMKFQRLAYEPTDCMLSASPRSPQPTYRSFMLSSQGKLMIFDSYNYGDSSTGTGAKTYHFFPRDMHPTVVDDANGKVVVHSANSKITFGFHPQKAVLVEMTGAEFTMDYDISPAAKGGLVLKKADVLVLDSGYTRGRDPTTVQKAKSIFRDAAGNRCEVVNTEVFMYFNGGDNKFQFNDAQLKTFLAKRCPNIKPGY